MLVKLVTSPKLDYHVEINPFGQSVRWVLLVDVYVICIVVMSDQIRFVEVFEVFTLSTSTPHVS